MNSIAQADSASVRSRVPALTSEPTTVVSPWIIAATVMLATFMEVLDTSIANVALPSIAGNLSATVDEGTWVLTSYLVSNAIVLPLTPWISSVFGRKRFYLACVILFTISSMLCGFAPSLPALVFFRVLQGVGGGALMPISQAILVESFPKRMHGIAMAIFGMGVMAAPVIGPSLGGWITDNYSWRWIFFINLPIGVLAFILTALLVSDPPYLRRVSLRDTKVDMLGLGLVALGLGLLQMVLDNGQKYDWFENNTILCMSIIVVVSLGVAVFWELRCDDPVVDLRLLKERNFCIATITMFLVGFVVYGKIVLYPIYLQNLMGYSPTKSGLVLSPGGIAIVLAMPVVGILLQKVEARWLMLSGLLIGSLALFQMAKFSLDVDFRTAVMALLVVSIGEALLFVPINAAAFAFVPKEKTNNGTGLINLARNVGGSMGIAAVSTILARRSQFHQSVLVSHLTPLDYRYRELVASAQAALISRGSDPASASTQAQGVVYLLAQRHAYMMAFVDAFYLLALVFLALVPLMFFMKKSKGGGDVPMH